MSKREFIQKCILNFRGYDPKSFPKYQSIVSYFSEVYDEIEEICGEGSCEKSSNLFSEDDFKREELNK